LIPGWWKKPLKEMRLATFNARSNSIADKPMFRDSFKKRRCLIPASGYFEWVTTEKGRQPYYFTRRDGQVITIAGIQDGWTDQESKEWIRSCSMVITEANKFVSDIHDRMPVVLEPKDFEQWERGDVKDAAALMKPASEDLLQKWPVSRRVSSSRADDNDVTLIEKIELATKCGGFRAKPVVTPPRRVPRALPREQRSHESVRRLIGKWCTTLRFLAQLDSGVAPYWESAPNRTVLGST
jgi:putative SOS response-associated peptidase YedK